MNDSYHNQHDVENEGQRAVLRPVGISYAETETRFADLRARAQNWDDLVRLLGYVENGSEMVVTVHQDDATRDYVITATDGNSRDRCGFGSSPAAALAHLKLNSPQLWED